MLYEVITMGAKVLGAIIQVFLTAALFLALGFADVFFLAARYSKVSEIIDAAKEILSGLSGLDITLPMILMTLFLIFICWISTIIFAMLSITLSTTVLENRKSKWIISFLSFILINVVVYKTMSLVGDQVTAGFYISSLVSAGISAVFIALASIGTSWMLEKRNNFV